MSLGWVLVLPALMLGSPEAGAKKDPPTRSYANDLETHAEAIIAWSTESMVGANAEDRLVLNAARKQLEAKTKKDDLLVRIRASLKLLSQLRPDDFSHQAAVTNFLWAAWSLSSIGGHVDSALLKASVSSAESLVAGFPTEANAYLVLSEVRFWGESSLRGSISALEECVHKASTPAACAEAKKHWEEFAESPGCTKQAVRQEIEVLAASMSPTPGFDSKGEYKGVKIYRKPEPLFRGKDILGVRSFSKDTVMIELSNQLPYPRSTYLPLVQADGRGIALYDSASHLPGRRINVIGKPKLEHFCKSVDLPKKKR